MNRAALAFEAGHPSIAKAIRDAVAAYRPSSVGWYPRITVMSAIMADMVKHFTLALDVDSEGFEAFIADAVTASADKYDAEMASFESHFPALARAIRAAVAAHPYNKGDCVGGSWVEVEAEMISIFVGGNFPGGLISGEIERFIDTVIWEASQ